MLPLQVRRAGDERLSLLVIGAHSDDIEIGCGATLATLIAQGRVGAVRWVVLTGGQRRATEARDSAEALLAAVEDRRVILREFRDGYFPYEGGEIKDFFEQLKTELTPDVIFTHRRADLHQDHRVTGELTWNTFRNHLILEYEIPKYDGDLGAPNLYVPIEESLVRAKLEHLRRYFGTQRSRQWFTDDLFSGLLRLRGIECSSPTSYAEAFHCRKAILA